MRKPNTVSGSVHDAPVDLDKPMDLMFNEVKPRKDVAACIVRHRGQTFLAGAVVKPGNSTRSGTGARMFRSDECGRAKRTCFHVSSPIESTVFAPIAQRRHSPNGYG